jgi:hypothetical protein
MPEPGAPLGAAGAWQGRVGLLGHTAPPSTCPHGGQVAGLAWPIATITSGNETSCPGPDSSSLQARPQARPQTRPLPPSGDQKLVSDLGERDSGSENWCICTARRLAWPAQGRGLRESDGR